MPQSTRVHPTAFLDQGVELGEGVTVGPGAVLIGPCEIGDGVWVGAGASLGAPPEMSNLPQHAGWAGDPSYMGIVIGARTVIRELAVIHQGSHRATRVGDDSWILNRAYLAHDVIVGNGVTISAGVSIGGHCTIGDAANLGMNASVHQNRVIGSGAMIGMGTPLTRDVPPFGKAFGSPARLQGVNTIGMSRRGISEAEIALVVEAYESGDMALASLQVSNEILVKAVAAWNNAAPAKVFPSLG